VRLLLDENLSPRLVRRCAGRGHLAAHVAHRGLAGASDAALFAYAARHDFIVATINRGDFLTLAADAEAHPGLIVLRRAGLDAEGQWRLLAAAIDAIEAEGGGARFVNRVAEVRDAGAVVLYDLPP
jgi:predicted nuclease of predicted toxin-antitoxin system